MTSYNNKFRKQERLHRRFYIFFSLMTLPVHGVMYFTEYFSVFSKGEVKYILIAQQVILLNGLGLMIWIFTTLYLEIKEFVNYEFRKNRKQFLVFFIIFVTTILLDLLNSWNSARFNIESVNREEVIDYCEERRTIDAISLIISQFNLGKLFFAFVLIKIKSSDDILNGTSKLDNLIKSSIF